eukprot:5646266-Prymnesium_polylepis.1
MNLSQSSDQHHVHAEIVFLVASERLSLAGLRAFSASLSAKKPCISLPNAAGLVPMRDGALELRRKSPWHCRFWSIAGLRLAPTMGPIPLWRVQERRPVRGMSSRFDRAP